MDYRYICVHPWGCTEHHLACTVQPRRYTGTGASVTFARGGVVEYCVSEKTTAVPSPQPRLTQTAIPTCSEIRLSLRSTVFQSHRHVI